MTRSADDHDKRILVTGGAGFIGSALVRKLVRETDALVVNVDKLTYAGNLDSLDSLSAEPRHRFERVDVCDRADVARVFGETAPTAVIHLAAESHVDRSIDGPATFVQTNLVGTFTMLEEARRHLLAHPDLREGFRFLHVSTDEVYGSLDEGGFFDEGSRYEPSSPYSATKAGADHLARAWCRTFGVPVIVTNCSNNYGPYQFPEKLIPHMILRGLQGQELPIYGRGQNVRDWLHVDDHAEALLAAMERGRIGETYLLGGREPRRNVDVVKAICALLDELAPGSPASPREDLIRFVEDRPGHDVRYAIDPSKAETELGWRPLRRFEEGLRETVEWYLENQTWWERVISGDYRVERLGLGTAAWR